MECPVCGHSETAVVDTRTRGDRVIRRRRCTNCGHKFVTTEMVGTFDEHPALSSEDKRVIRRAIDRITAALGIAPQKIVGVLLDVVPCPYI